ncbi:MAG: nucleotidyltransferase family protein [Actinobacteria bacterium]|nr:nucleotidyltransferase family protein [Actinomycetota bacterium]
MQALVLAAGWATRLGALALATPKHLLPIGRGCSLDIVVDRLCQTPNIRAIHIITHRVYHPQFVAWQARRTRPLPVHIMSDGTRSVDERLGSIGDIAYFIAESRLQDDLLIVAGDNVFDFGLADLATRAEREPVVGVYDVGSLELASRYGVVELDTQGYVTSFVEKPAQPRSSLAAIAIYGFPRATLGDVHAYLAAGGSPDKSGSLIEWLHTRRRVAGHVFVGHWFDIGSPDEYARVQELFGAEADQAWSPAQV